MNVLSLFDGMSCGQIALDRLGVKVDKYFASEVDKWAIQTAKKNYPNTIHLGDVQQVMWPESFDGHKIDLLIGGSPCQGFSFAGKQLNFDDPRSKLFFEFVRLLRETKPRYFLLENVKMKKESEQVITDALGVEPIEINSSLVSAQSRKRLYWTNLPVKGQPEDKGILLADVLEYTPADITLMSERFTSRNSDAGCLMDYTKPKASNLSAMEYVKNGRQGDYIRCTRVGTPSLSESHWRKLTPLECERLQTVPEGYTEGVSNTQRYRMIGNGWTVDVICHLMQSLVAESHGQIDWVNQEASNHAACSYGT